MKDGDMVRFAKWGEFDYNEPWHLAAKPHIGMLIEYDRLMKIAHILHEGEMLSIRAQFVEKAGKRDGLKENDD